MPKGLRRIYGGGDFHFVTCSCYRRQALLKSARRRDIFLEILEQVRKKFGFVVGGPFKPAFGLSGAVLAAKLAACLGG
jgi:hypothetical protein